jgi:hypothetical protein
MGSARIGSGIEAAQRALAGLAEAHDNQVGRLSQKSMQDSM